MLTVAEFLVNQLQSAGVERVYGLPGGENVALLDALRKCGIDFVLVKNESSACFMAATEARLTGGIGVALTTLGPGAANAFAGLAHAHLDRAPLLLITAASDPDVFSRHTHQVLDLGAIFRPVCKFTAHLTPATAVGAIQRALALAKAGRPGPVHLGVHNRVAGQSVLRAHPSPARSEPKREEMDTHILRRFLASSRRPIIVAGLGLEPDAPYRELRALADALGAPFIDTPKSKGALPHRHPLFAGTLGLTRSDPAYELLDEADSVIALGFDVVELVKPWDYTKPLLWIANWRNEKPRLHSEIEAVGDIGALLREVTSLASTAAADWGVDRARRFRSQLAARRLPAAQPGRVLPQTFLQSLRGNTPDNIIVTTDVGSHKIFAALEWQAQQPNRYFVSNGLSAMGFGLASAMAAAMVSAQPTVCITGDAGLAMVLGELSLLADRALPVLVAVMNDAALDLIRSAQARQGRPAFGTEFSNPDYRQIAAAFGLAYRRADSRASCDRAIQDWLKAAYPMLMDVMIDPSSYPTTVESEN